MKLLMENWRKFVAETERTKNYGDLYLFENDSVQKVSFYDRFSTLNENDDDFKLFLEQWEKSVDYQLGLLSEGVQDDRRRARSPGPGEEEAPAKLPWDHRDRWSPEDFGLTQEEYDYIEDFKEKYLAARGTPAHPLRDPVATHLHKKANRHMMMNDYIPFFAQGYMLLQRGGEAAGKVLSVAKKMKEKGPLGKAGGIILTGLVAAAALIGFKAIMDSGGDAGEIAQQVSELADAAAAVDPDIGQALEQAVQNPETIVEIVPELDQAVSQSAEQLGQIDSEAAQQAAQEAEKVSQQIPEGDDFASMFEDTLSQTAASYSADIELSKSAGEQLASQIFDKIKGKLPHGVNIHDGMSINGANQLGIDSEVVHNSFHETMKSSLEGAGLEGGKSLNSGEELRERGISIKVHMIPVEAFDDRVRVEVSLLKNGKVVEILDEFVTQI